MKRRVDRSKRYSSKGFSLVELAIVMAAGGLLLAGALSTYKVNTKRIAFQDTELRMQVAGRYITQYLVEQGGIYPCPATPGLPPGDPMKGKSNCAALLAMPTGNTCDAGGLCKVVGARDVMNLVPVPAVYIPGDPIALPVPVPSGDGTPEHVYIGVLPYADLGMNYQDTKDLWGNELLFAVTETLTIDEAYGAKRGVIRLVDAADVVIPKNPNRVDAILVSHGMDERGAYNFQGKIGVPCAGAAALDGENCDGDMVFRSAPRALGATAGYNDDLIYTAMGGENDTWSFKPGDVKSAVSYNQVGIGTNDPFRAIHVNDNGVPNDGNVKAQKVILSGDLLETYAGPRNISPDRWGGIRNPADSGDALDCKRSQGIDNGAIQGVYGGVFNSADAHCVEQKSFPMLNPFTCPVGQYVKGVDAGMNIICGVP